jgi:hypothetical protein
MCHYTELSNFKGTIHHTQGQELASISMIAIRVQPTQRLHRCILFRRLFACEPSRLPNQRSAQEERNLPQLCMLWSAVFFSELGWKLVPLEPLLE